MTRTLREGHEQVQVATTTTTCMHSSNTEEKYKDGVTASGGDHRRPCSSQQQQKQPMSVHELKRQLKQNLPASTFTPKPFYGHMAYCITALWVFLLVTCHVYQPSWPILLVVAIVTGQVWTITDFAAHEAMHGAVYENPLAIEALVYLSFSHHLIGAEGWRGWHMRAHHGYTNQAGLDPDVVGLHHHKEELFTKFVNFVTIGQKRGWSAFFLFFQFTVQGQLVLWFHATRWQKDNSKNNKKRVEYDVTKARLETIVLVFLWSRLMSWLGCYHSLWLLVLPLLMCNGTLMSYICTQHFLRPISTGYDPLPTTLSVRTLDWLDVLHLRFSYHREHHLFPSMSHSMAPVVRKEMERLLGCPSAPLTHRQALRLVLGTPRLYQDSHTLSFKDQTTNLVDLWKTIDPSEAALVQSAERHEFQEHPADDDKVK